jgi:hypothetical protein
MDASSKVLVIQEGREGTFRNVPNRVLVHRFGSPGVTTVAEVVIPGVANFNAESSGVIDASHVLGKDWWLLDVQAHNITTAPQPGPTLTPGRLSERTASCSRSRSRAAKEAMISVVVR